MVPEVCLGPFGTGGGWHLCPCTKISECCFNTIGLYRTIYGITSLGECRLYFSLHLIVDLCSGQGNKGFNVYFMFFVHLSVTFLLSSWRILVCWVQNSQKWQQYIQYFQFWCTLCSFYGMLQLIGLLVFELNIYIELT